MSSLPVKWGGGVLLLVLALAAPAGAQGLTFEKTVDFVLNKQVPLEGKAGDIEIQGIEFTAGDAKSGFIKGTFGGSEDADLNSVVTTRLECSTMAETKWKADITIEFVDASGELIDRVKSDAAFKANAKILEIKRTMLSYAAGKIASVRLKVQATGKN